MRLLKKLPDQLKAIIDTLDRAQYDAINLYFQDESRFGLMTRQKRVLVSKGIKPIGKFQHSYKWVWLWGCFSPISGDAFYWETPYVSNKIFEAFLQDFSQQNPKELKIVIIDNAGFHALKHIKVPGNIYLINIPSYAPELNPAEKVWQWFKDHTAMKFFASIDEIQEKITILIHRLKPQMIKSMTGYELYTKPFFEKV